MEQPKIKVIPFQSQSQSPQEIHAYDPTAPADYKVQEPKTVGNMTQDEFLDLLIEGIIKANQVMEQKEELATPTEKPNHPNFLSNIAGTIGDVAHGVVDIAEGILRGAIDLITFGQSKRK